MPINPNDTYTSPLSARNASPEMCRIWSPRHKFNTWRRVWLAVAEAQYEVTKDWGSDGTALRAVIPASSSKENSDDGSESRPTQPLVTKEQVEELRAVVERGITDEELVRAGEIERDLRHDVMAHVHCLGEQCPKAGPIIHLGMTSQDVGCNTELLLVRESIGRIQRKLFRVVLDLSIFSRRWIDTPVLGLTHYQPAQPVTIGRRSISWAAELFLTRTSSGIFELIPDLRGFRGATGTQASYVSLFGSEDIASTFDDIVLSKLRAGYSRHHTICVDRESVLSDPRLDTKCYPTSQTYPRIFDTFVLSNLAASAAVLHKIATDIRLLSNRKELDEPFGDKQIGSSAMPYKRNPMKCERICGLTRFVMNLVGNAYDTAATQWLERTLDDSSNRRLSLPEAFLALDGALDLMHTVASGLVVNEAMVKRNLMAELPFLATENILMEAVKAGADRQQYHEIIRVHAHKAGHRVKQEGLDNDLLERLQNDPAFHPPALTRELDWDGLMDPMKYIGRSVEQTERFLEEVIEPLRERYADELESLGPSDRGV